VISGKEDPSSGFIHRAKGARVGYLEQIPDWPEAVTVRETLMSAFRDLTDIQKKLRMMEGNMAHTKGNALEALMLEYDEAQRLYEIRGGYEMDEKLGRIVTGLKLEDFIEQSTVAA
ncbi:ABC-F type ribosomal protection protein, partial [Aduncisulcus paluster]